MALIVQRLCRAVLKPLLRVKDKPAALLRDEQQQGKGKSVIHERLAQTRRCTLDLLAVDHAGVGTSLEAQSRPAKVSLELVRCQLLHALDARHLRHKVFQDNEV